MLTGTIQAITQRDIKNGGKLFKVTIDGTEYITFDQGLAFKAKHHENRVVQFQFHERPARDGYPADRQLDAVDPVTSTQAPPTIMSSDSLRQVEIRRAVALKAAVDILIHLPEAERTLDSIETISKRLYDFLESDWKAEPAPASETTDPDTDIPF